MGGERTPLADRLGALTVEADRYRLENAVQLRHLTASIVGKAASITVRRDVRVTDNARAAGRSIA
jgi:hypothetical protein